MLKHLSHFAHEVHPHPISGGDVDRRPVVDVAQPLDVVAVVAVVRGLGRLCQVILMKYTTHHENDNVST